MFFKGFTSATGQSEMLQPVFSWPFSCKKLYCKNEDFAINVCVQWLELSKTVTWLTPARSYRTEGAIAKWRQAVPPPTTPMEVSIVTAHQNLSERLALKVKKKGQDVMMWRQRLWEKGDYITQVIHSPNKIPEDDCLPLVCILRRTGQGNPLCLYTSGTGHTCWFFCCSIQGTHNSILYSSTKDTFYLPAITT